MFITIGSYWPTPYDSSFDRAEDCSKKPNLTAEHILAIKVSLLLSNISVISEYKFIHKINEQQKKERKKERVVEYEKRKKKKERKKERNMEY